MDAADGLDLPAFRGLREGQFPAPFPNAMDWPSRVAKEVQPVAESTLTVGMDVHKESVAVAVLRGHESTPYLVQTLPHDPSRLRRFFGRLRREGEVRACYEASGCGYVLQRAMGSWGVPCEVIAPSLIPKRSGDRRKTDRRDAVNLAHLYRAGELTAVRVPSEAEESVRSLLRCREAISHELQQSRQRIVKHLYARGVVYTNGKHWTLRHMRWLRALTLEAHDALVLHTHLTMMDHKSLHLAGLDEKIEALSHEDPYRAPVARLRCLRGVDTLTAMGIVVEIGDVRRFPNPRALMGYLGLTVSEYSSGGTERRGGITKAGNGRARRLLVEAAWHYRFPARSSTWLQDRRRGQDPALVVHAERAEHRLHKRYFQLQLRMPTTRAVTAVARELSGFVWAILWNEPHLLSGGRR